MKRKILILIFYCFPIRRLIGISILSTLFISHYSLSQSGWFPLTTGTSTALNKIQFVNSQTGWVGGFQGFPTYYILIKTTNAGITWIDQTTNFPTGNRIMSLSFIDANTGWVAGADGLFKTTNGGNNYSTQPPLTFACTDCFFVNSVTGWVSVATGNSELYKTTDGGNSWTTQIFSATPYSQYAYIHFENSNTGWCAEDSVIFKTTNGGTNWFIQNHPSIFPFNIFNNVFAISPEIAWVAGTSGTILSTTNGGINWISKNIGSNYSVKSVYFINSLTGYASTSPRNVFKTTNNGLIWTAQMTDTVSVLNSIYFTSNDTGYACGSGGKIYKTINGGSIGIRKTDENTPVKFCLYQNFPNPFNPSTIIRYATPLNPPFDKGGTGGFVTLKVYDILEKEVATLVNDKLKAGEYEVTFDGGGLASGIYFYKLTAENFSETKKMLLIK